MNTSQTGGPVAVRRPRRAAASPDARLLYWFAVSLPFPMLGIPLNEFFVLSITSILGLVFAARQLMRHAWTPLHSSAFVMLATFVATAITRHPVSSYALSVAALGLAVLPLTTPATRPGDLPALLRGLERGLWLTLTTMVASLLAQFGGAGLLPAELTALVVHPEAGQFLGYVRPTGGFSEPSHLAIFLTTVIVVLDLSARTRPVRMHLRLAILGALVVSGSLAGIVLLVAYQAARAVAGAFRLLRRAATRKRLRQAAGLLLVSALMLSFVDFSSVDFFDEYLERLIKTQEDVASLNLVGSEGSRILAVLALPDYWDEHGFDGFLIGTGYANYQDWLLSTYGHLGESATFARGQIDNLMIAVFLSTGVVGFLAYLRFLRDAFSGAVLRAVWPVGFYVVAVNFSYGYLISGLYWHLLFVLASAARVAVAGRDASPVVGRRARRRSVKRRTLTAASDRALENASVSLP